MNLEQLRRIEAISHKLEKSIPPSHPAALDVLRSPALVHEAMDAAVELAKLNAGADYINSQPEDRRDKLAFSQMQGKLNLYKRRVESANELEKQLIGIAVKHQLEDVARKAGAINPSIVGDYALMSFKLTQTVDKEGNVVVLEDGRPITSAIADMTFREDTQHLFDRERAGAWSEEPQSYTGENPWKEDSLNLTEQGRIYRADPALAARLRDAATNIKPPKGSNPWAKETFNLTEQGRIYKQDPLLAARLKVEAEAYF